MTELYNYEKSFESKENPQSMWASNKFYLNIFDKNNGIYLPNTQVQLDTALLYSAPEWWCKSQSSIQIPYQVTAKVLSGTHSFKAVDLKKLICLNGDSVCVLDACSVNIQGQQITRLESQNNINANFQLISTMCENYKNTSASQHGFVLQKGDPDYTASYGETVYDANVFQKKSDLMCDVSDAKFAKFQSQNNVENREKDHYIKNSTVLMTWNYLIDIPLNSINDVLRKMPDMMHGAHLKLNLLVHTGEVNITQTGNNISNLSVSTPHGTLPYMINPALLGANITASNDATVIRFQSSIKKTKDAVSANPLNSSAVSMRCAMHKPRPEFNTQLQKRGIVKMDYTTFTSKFRNSINPNEFIRENITSSTSKARYLLLFFKHSASVNFSTNSTDITIAGGNTPIDPMESPFSSCPITSKPYCSITDFNVDVGSQRLWERESAHTTQLMFKDTFQTFNSLDGAENLQLSNGIIAKELYEKLYAGYIVVDLNKYTTVNEWVGIKSLDVSFKNNTLNKMDCIMQLFEEESVAINVNTGELVV